MSEKPRSGMAEFGAVVLAAGSGSRMNGKIAKQYLPLNGRPLIYYALREFEKSAVARIVLVVAAGHEDYCRKEIVERFGFSKVSAIVAGGNERYDSVQAGLQALSGVDYALIHDGARPFVDQAMLARTMEAVKKEQAVVVGMPVKDTIKVVNSHQMALETPDRSTLWQVQTPQAFSYPLIRDAYDLVLAGRTSVCAEAVWPLTDDAQVLELAFGKKCKLIEGSYRNIKVTTPEDLEIAEVFCRTLENRCIQNLELGFGDDTMKIILNTKGTMDDISTEMKRLLNFIDGKEPEDDFTRELDEAVQSIRKNEKWRLEYMTLQMKYQEKYEQGIEQEKRQFALRMIEDGNLSLEKIALYSGLAYEQVLELEKKLQKV